MHSTENYYIFIESSTMKKETKLRTRHNKKKILKTVLTPIEIELIEQTTGCENVRKIQYPQKHVREYCRGN